MYKRLRILQGKMLNMSTEREFEEARETKNCRYFYAEAAVVATEDAGAAYQGPSLIAAGANAQHVSLLSAMLNLSVALLCLKLPTLMKKIGSRKKTVVMMAFLDAFTWLPLIAAMYFLRPVAPFLLIALWVFNLLPCVLLLPLRDNWLADIVPAKVIGRHLGVRAAIATATYVGMFYLMGYILDAYNGEIFIGFVLISGIALFATLVKAIIYSRIEDNHSYLKQVDFSVSEFLQETKKEGLGRFILFTSLFNFAVSLCSPLFPVYMIKHLKFSYTTFALVFSSEFVGKVVSAPFWGRHSDNVGNLHLIKKLSYLIPLVPLLWLASSNVIYLIGVQFFSGVVWAGFDICSRRLLYTAASPEKRAGYLVYEKSLVTAGQAMGALSGAGILGFMIPVMGQKILGMFLLSGIMRFVVAKTVFPNIKAAEAISRSSPTKDLAANNPGDNTGADGYSITPGQKNSN